MRDRYQPVESVFAADARPSTVAQALASDFGFPNVYVADLDALAGGPPDWESLQGIADCGLGLWCDVGINSPQDVLRVRSSFSPRIEIQRLIIALESVPGPESLASIFEAAADLSPVFSLDLQNGQPMTTASGWKDQSPVGIAKEARSIGFSRFVVLDLAHVGTTAGPGVEALCRQLRDLDPDIELTSGGGVRDLGDLRRFREAGCNAVLVASALHDGRLTAASIRDAESW